jgi:hypothetical protein
VERYSEELLAVIAWEMSETGQAVRDTVMRTLAASDIRYVEAPPGNFLLRFDAIEKYHVFRGLLEDEELEDTWPPDFPVHHAGPFRWVLAS